MTVKLVWHDKPSLGLPESFGTPIDRTGWKAVYLDTSREADKFASRFLDGRTSFNFWTVELK